MAGALALWAGTAAAGFDRPTLCKGQMRFYNEDKSFTLYDMRLELDSSSYRVQAQSADDPEGSDDRGRCGAYLGGWCRHSFPPNEDGTVEYFEFRLLDRGNGRYLYSEAWFDGFTGDSLMRCVAR
ncbi:hypothetical protein AVJ23_06635 [Pseudoponticoccus marisrubri]|uniref:Uncharacterized protein n=2 Tax=Pseudoponticoccus marisrubri TaxID=1685382 RepID=A0A0W7WLE7_9RHOB|nr:hypothetical protein AVJ23_06635 [Pseudoponticoccus marisrubri]